MNATSHRRLRTLIVGRSAVLMAVASLLATGGGAVALAAGSGAAAGPPSTADQEKGMKTGLPFKEPPNADVDAGAHGDLAITLDAKDTHVDVAGKKVWGQSYNGDFVAPTIHVNPGANVTV